MQRFRISHLAGATAVACAAFVFASGISSPALAQNQASVPNAPQQPVQQQSPEEKILQEIQRRTIEEYDEAAKLPGTAGLPECVWGGRRIAALLWRDDLDTASRHLALYERFGCPTEHLKLTFRCLVRQGHMDPKAQERLAGRVHQCWVNPDFTPAIAPQTPPPEAAPATPAEDAPPQDPRQ
ncbi:hypothetical protein ACT6QG_10095 [Xanthobacter sp. TB0136]|uniref:hypothetical protein n=1 Tax=Xanthobacter sp. TB0136 TaxID=3459177 RepID=UPI00403986A1